MLKSLLPILFLCAVFEDLLAQSIQVLDKENYNSIEHVLIFDEQGNQVVTDAIGMASISNLSNGVVTFQHVGYKTRYIARFDMPNVVYLTLSTISVKEVVVSANKWEEDVSEIPVTVTKISREDIALKNPQTAADILSQTGEVFVQKSQLGGGSPMIRGFAANSVLISVDGVRINNAIYRSGNLQNIIALDGLTTASAEVVFGPGSVIYGSDALGGVMDFHTISPKFETVYGEAFGRFSSANLEKTGHIKLNIGGKKLAFMGAITYSSFNDLVSGSVRKGAYPTFGTRPEYAVYRNGKDTIISNDAINKQVFSGYNQFNSLVKLSYAVSDDVDLSYAFHFTTSSDIPRYDRLTEYKNDTLKYGEWYYGPQKWLMHHFQIKSQKKSSLASESKLTAALQQVQESRNDRKLNSINLRRRTENVLVLSLNYDVFKELKTNTFYYGVEAVYNDVNSFGRLEFLSTNIVAPAATRYPDGGSTWMSFAGYVNLKHYFSASLILNMGIRYSHILLNSKFIDKSFYDFPYDKISFSTGATNGSIGLVWKISNALNLKSSINSGFRAPNVDDIGKVFDSEPGNVVVPNQNLTPEFSYSGELTLSGKISDELAYSFTGYYTRLVDAMVRRNFTFNGQDSIVYDGELSRVQALVNTGKAYIGGISGSLAYSFGSFTASSTLTYTTGSDLIENVPLRHVAPLFGQTSVAYKWKNINLLLTQRYNGAKTVEQLAPNEQNKPHIYTPNGSPSWTTTTVNSQFKITKNLVLNAGVENIFDVHYRPYSSGISAPGRNFILSLKAKFSK